MAIFNQVTKEITAKLVYYGPAFCGKATNLRWIHEHVAFMGKGEMRSLANESDRALFFNFIPVGFSAISVMTSREQIYPLPGLVFRDNSRGRGLLSVKS